MNDASNICGLCGRVERGDSKWSRLEVTVSIKHDEGKQVSKGIIIFVCEEHSDSIDLTMKAIGTNDDVKVVGYIQGLSEHLSTILSTVVKKRFGHARSHGSEFAVEYAETADRELRSHLSSCSQCCKKGLPPCDDGAMLLGAAIAASESVRRLG